MIPGPISICPTIIATVRSSIIRCSSGANVVWHGSGTFGALGGHLGNCHRISDKCQEVCYAIINQAQNSLHHLAGLFGSVVLFECADSKLHKCHNDCGDGSNIQNQSVDERPVESVGGFH